MAALSRQNIDTPVTLVNTIVLYEASARGKALALSQLLRKKGMAVQTMKRKEGAVLEAYREMAKRRGLRNILYLKGNGGIVTAMDMVNGSADEIPYSAYGE